MFTRAKILQCLLLLLLWPANSSGQQKESAASPPTAVLEFPITLQEGVEAGKTAVGNKVHAKLAVATLVNRVVIPKGAIFSGVVIESVGKAAKGASRLAIRIDSAQWKDGSAKIKAYLTPLYYPKTVSSGPSLQYGPTEPPAKTWNGEGQYPNSGSRVYRPFPGGESDDTAGAVPDTTSATMSGNPVGMKDVAVGPAADGGLTLVCNRANLKLDEQTIYVLAAAAQ